MKKISYKIRKNILKEAVVLLITVILSLSTITVTANSEISNSGVAPLDVVLLSEGFEDGLMPPDDWTVEVYESSYTWKIVTDTNWVYSGARAAQCPSRGSRKQMEWLITPEIDLDGGYEEATLTFWCRSRCTWDEGTVKLYIDDEGDGFDDPDDVVWDMLADEDWVDFEWRKMEFDLEEYLGTTIKIAWYYFADLDLWRFCLDEVTVTTPGHVPKTELNIGKISGYPNVCAEIKNIGNISAKVVKWSISMKGGIMDMIDVSNDGEIERLRVGDEEIVICTGSFFGFGKVTIDVTIESESARPEKVTRSSTGFVFLFKFYPGV